MDSNYRLFAEVSIGISIISLAILALSVPSLYDLVDIEQQDTVEKSAKFKKSADIVWVQLLEAKQVLSGIPGRASFFTRNRRSDWLNGGGFCKGCFQLACPMGLPGPPGPPGPDGLPGDAGRPGKSGDDGYDVQLESEPEMPCVVCPAGPPGPRGSQGERGLAGSSGQFGEPGPDGSFGMDGPLGPPGIMGSPGLQGPVGPKGEQGDTLIAGVGVKGPVGPPGPQGMKGRPGPPGKSSNSPGSPGQPGTVGGIGQTGKQGAYGQEGPYGPPGDPGMPASYCPSDCGVQNILTDIFPSHAQAKLNQYSAPPGQMQEYSSTPTNQLSNYERRLRKKMIKKMLALQRFKQ